MRQPIIAVTGDVRHFDNYTWHAAPQTYLEAAVGVARVTPLIVPAFAGRIDIEAILDHVDGVMATGSKTNVHPTNYDVAPTVAHEPFDEARDNTAIPLLRSAVERGVPVLAICRGFQELNVALGGSIATEIQEIAGKQDHRAANSEDQKERFRIHQPVHVKPGSCLAEIIGAGRVEVNSLHRQAVERLARDLDVEAVADDGTIEAVSVRNSLAFAVGVQWHPEFWASQDKPSMAIFEAFGDAARHHLFQRSRKAAAE
ncbi:MAG: gamma-glutamyl-gamma-aminobutyrate hydrolase family protein [Rhizobiaceae bacterium]